jgi:hypothetical protein
MNTEKIRRPAIHMTLCENTNHGTGADSCNGWIRV